MFRNDPMQYTTSSANAFAALQRETLHSLSVDDSGTENSSAVCAEKINIDGFLCLQCLIRKELFEKIKQSLPRSFRRSLRLKWPMMAIDEKAFSVPIVPIPTVVRSVDEDAAPFENMSRIMSPPRSPLLEQANALLALTRPDSSGGRSAKDDKSNNLMIVHKDQDTDSDSWPANDNVLTLGQLSELSSTIEPSFGSPIVSKKLQELDFYSAVSIPIAPIRNIKIDEDEMSLPSMSGLSLAASQEGSLISQASVLTVVDPLKRPKEVTLLPFLVAKGHFEEAERVVRMAIGKTAIDEGEGMFLLLKILAIQADMYKLMGLWPLALSILIDVADLTVNLLGFGDRVTLQALSLVSSCFRKMQKPALADEYMKFCIEQLGYNLKMTIKDNLIERLQQLNRYQPIKLLSLIVLSYCLH
jgi:hypothetical protein